MSFWDQIKYFKPEEFTCRCGCGRNGMEASFMYTLEGFRATCGFPIIITSGYRCPDHNEKISSTGRAGPHTTGCAADISIAGVFAFKVLSLCDRAGFTGIGIKQHGVHTKRYIHLDTLEAAPSRPRPWVWSYP